MQEHCPESGVVAVILLEDVEELAEPHHEVGREICQGKVHVGHQGPLYPLLFLPP